jgi:F420-dependent oxidoreductase-like protein
MKIGLQIPDFSWTGGAQSIAAGLRETALAADASGFSSLWVMDHFFQIQMIGSPAEPMLEAYSALNFLAGITQNVKLGALVTGVIYRQPAILVKTVTTLDVLSGGRAILGIGAAWNEEESRGLGIPFPPLKERFERLEEALQIAHWMWAGNQQPFTGKYHHLEKPLNYPAAIQNPHPLILIGGSGEQKTLRLVAQYADACNLFARTGRETLIHKLDVLKGYCDAAARPYEAIEKTALSSAIFKGEALDLPAMEKECRVLAEIGIQQVIYNLPHRLTAAHVEEIGRELLPAVTG